MVRPYVSGDPTSLADLRTYFPDARPAPPAGCFEFALAASGGISTGSYIAGVLDFLIEALQAFEAAQKADPAGTPSHTVKLVNLTGASAGGLSAALATTCLLKQVPHVYADTKWTDLVAAGLKEGVQTPQLNPLYASWVQLIDLEGLLAAPTPAETEISLFAPMHTRISDTVLRMLKDRPAAEWPDWADRPLDLRMAFGNLRGVPYALNFENVPDAGAGERLTLHRDHLAFAVSTEGKDGAPDAWPLAGGDDFDNGASAWRLWNAAAVASAAIPGVFAPATILGQSIDVYQWRDCWYDTQLRAPMLDQPFWQAPPASLDFTAVDGGLFDNEPFDIAHRMLAGVSGANPRAGDVANRAVVLVTPFVNDRLGDPVDPLLPSPGQAASPPPTPLARLFAAAGAIFNAPIEQSRWDAFDLGLVKSEDVYSRYLIAPSRENPNPAAPAMMLGPSRSLMSWPLHLGLGYAAEAYRRHDYLLGRRNAQRFLSDSFMLPADNPIIRDSGPWEAADRRQGRGPDGSPTDFYPIIPLRGAVHQRFPEPLPAWNWAALSDGRIKTLRKLFGGRVNYAWRRVQSSLTAAPPGASILARLGLAVFWIYLSLGWCVLRWAIVNGFKDQLTAARGQLDPANYPPP